MKQIIAAFASAQILRFPRLAPSPKTSVMNPSTLFVWQCLSFKNLAAVGVIAIASGTVSGETPQYNATVVGAIIGLVSALLVVVIGKSWDGFAERRKEKRRKEGRAIEDQHSTDIRFAELTIQERQELRKEMMAVYEQGRRILEEEMDRLRCERNDAHRRIATLEARLEERDDE